MNAAVSPAAARDISCGTARSRAVADHAGTENENIMTSRNSTSMAERDVPPVSRTTGFSLQPYPASRSGNRILASFPERVADTPCSSNRERELFFTERIRCVVAFGGWVWKGHRPASGSGLDGATMPATDRVLRAWMRISGHSDREPITMAHVCNCGGRSRGGRSGGVTVRDGMATARGHTRFSGGPRDVRGGGASRLATVEGCRQEPGRLRPLRPRRPR
jgi:hypothetical protein